jgi:Spy/CpxP family protein refolding chaperone
MRYALMIVLGLVIGVAGTVMAMTSLNRGPHFPESLMHMQGFHMRALDANTAQHRCAVSDTQPQLQALRALSNDIEPVFLPIEKEQDFRQKASDMRASLDSLLAAPPADCTALGAAIHKLERACKSCHDEFRS